MIKSLSVASGTDGVVVGVVLVVFPGKVMVRPFVPQIPSEAELSDIFGIFLSVL